MRPHPVYEATPTTYETTPRWLTCEAIVLNPTSVAASGRLYLVISPWMPTKAASKRRLVTVAWCPKLKKEWEPSMAHRTHASQDTAGGRERERERDMCLRIELWPLDRFSNT